MNVGSNPSHGVVFKGKEAGAGAVDEEDFIKAFEDAPSAQVCWSQTPVAPQQPLR